MKNEDLLPVLAIETSGELCSVAVMTDENVYSEVNIQKKYVHSQKLFSLIDQAVINIDIDKNSLNSVAVSMGPGSFTGLRIGLAAAKGIAHGLQIPIIPVPTFSAAARSIHKNSVVDSKIAIINRVNSSELYLQKFLFNNSDGSDKSELEIILQSDLEIIPDEFSIFGNFEHDKVVQFESPGALAIAEWAYFFGQDLVTFEYDYLEPNYVKKFIVRTKK